MCGIAGLVDLSGAPVSPATIKRMTDAIAHRGLDGEGQWAEANFGLGHRRLAIIDLSQAAAQPMFSRDGRWVLSYNGEVYNYREIKRELLAEGLRFESETDTEVVLYALAKWGNKALLRFNGMFALSLWDRHEKRLLLARDRYGIKPLYYTRQGVMFAFGSEQKTFTGLDWFKKSLNKPALLEYFTFQNFLTDQTLLEEVHILPAGHFAILDTKLQEHAYLEMHQYWDYHFREPQGPIDEAEYVEELRRLFEQAVTRQLVGDVELGAYLSGGIDSGSITAVAARQLPNLKSFTCGFDLSSAQGLELDFDERAKAEAISAMFKTEHYEIVLKAGDMERCIPSLAYHLEEPRVGQSYPNFYAAKLASKFVKVVLSGTGGDELFGGYPWRYYKASQSLNFSDFIDNYYLYWQRLLSNSELKKLFSLIWPEVKDVWTRDIFESVFASHDNALVTPADYVNHCLYFEAKTFLHGLFMVEDKLSMAHGLESRVPFMDNDLVEFALNCPASMKVGSFENNVRIDENLIGRKQDVYFAKTRNGKRVMRQALSSYLPSSVTDRPKQGFSGPDASWFKHESRETLLQGIMKTDGGIWQFLDQNCARSLLNEHFDGVRNRRLLVWSILAINNTFVQKTK